jgi:hypothetical protein
MHDLPSLGHSDGFSGCFIGVVGFSGSGGVRRCTISYFYVFFSRGSSQEGSNHTHEFTISLSQLLSSLESASEWFQEKKGDFLGLSYFFVAM